MPNAFFAALFFVLLAAGIFLESVSWGDAIGYVIFMGLVAVVFWLREWASIWFLIPMLLMDAFLILKVFERDLWVPPTAGGPWH